ncbi:MAG: hypothetical protein NTW87_07065 [Planctomycetota bacterium]|nr:hypothetical protein [Planctomycetota bacterium]
MLMLKQPMSRRASLALVALFLVAEAARGLEDSARVEAVALLAEQTEAALTAGEQPSVWLTLLGQRKSYAVSAVDSKTITVLIEQNPYPVQWSRIPREDLAGIAKAIARDKGERLVVASEVALMLGFPERADDCLTQIRDPDEALKTKIRGVTRRMAEAKVAVAAPPAVEKKAPDRPQQPAQPPATIVTPPASASTPAKGPVINVGPTRACKTIVSALAKATAGETILVDPGTYNEVFKMRNEGRPDAPVTLRGVRGANGERPVLDATGLSVSGAGPVPRAIIQIEGSYCAVEGLELKNARNGNNGAGFRFLDCTHAVVRDCKVTYCDMGMQGGDKETLLVHRCEVAFNGTKDYNGYSHNFYLLGNRAVIRECHIHDSLFGQNFKTRGHCTELWYNVICDSEEGEIGFVDGDASGAPNSNALLVGNVVVSKPDRKGNATKYVEFGGEGKGRNGTLSLFNNTFVAGSPRILFVRLWEATNDLVAYNNILVGSSKPPEVASGKMKGAGNLFSGSAPPGFGNTLKGSDPLFVNAAARDFRLQGGSPCVNAGAPADALTYADGDGKALKAVPEQHPGFPMSGEPRPKKAALDIGAFGVP